MSYHPHRHHDPFLPMAALSAKDFWDWLKTNGDPDYYWIDTAEPKELVQYLTGMWPPDDDPCWEVDD